MLSIVINLNGSSFLFVMTLQDLFHTLVLDSGLGLEQISRPLELPHFQSARIPLHGVWHALDMDCTLQYGNYAGGSSDGSEDLSVTLSHSKAYRAANPRGDFTRYKIQLYFYLPEWEDPEGSIEKSFVLEIFPPKHEELRRVFQSLLETKKSEFDMLYRILGRKGLVEYRKTVSEDAAKTLLYTLVGVGQRPAPALELYEI